MISVLFGTIAILWTTTTCAAFTIPASPHGTIEPWSRIATIDRDGSICQDCREVVAKYDLSSPREWMEFLEATEGHGGAYTVIRCDYKQASWRIWGRDFHMKRLCQSYCTVMDVNEKQLSNITETTSVILDSLLEQASLILSKSADVDAMYTVMVTILWQNGTRDASTLVRGHICCSGTAVFDHNVSLPEAITATLALSFDEREELPNRYSHFPEAKLSSWCRERRLLEQEFKVNGAAEVLLTRNVDNHVHILEGLTSNVFFLYPDKKVRTSNTGVLMGYARQLVLDCLTEEVGLEYDPTPIRIEDASLWKELFLTSSIRLVIPVKQILIPDKEGEFHNLWLADRDEYPTCKELYTNLLKGEYVSVQ